MITIFAPFADRLNLNGDQGNVLVLTRYFEVLGIETNVLGSFHDLKGVVPHFVFLGHGSDAAMKSIEQELQANVETLKALHDSVPGLAVGSSMIWLARNGFSSQSIQPGDHESRFDVAEISGIKVLGYRNTDSGLASLAKAGRWFECMLHGPLLAKNPALLVEVASHILESASIEVDLAVAKNWLEKVSAISAKIWSIETDQEFERAV